MRTAPLVSINIRTYNSGSTFKETLDSIKHQTYRNIELIIADGGSTDETITIAKRYKAVIHFAKKLGEARQKNFQKSRGAYVFSVDSDQILDGDVVSQCVALCQKGYDAIIISEKSKIRKGTYVERVIAYDKWLVDKTRATDPVFGTASPRFFRKSLLVTINWLHVLSIFDDTILYEHLLNSGAVVGYLHTSSIRHYEVTSFWQVFNKFYRYGQGYFEALRHNPTTIAVHSLPRMSYFRTEALTKPYYLIGLMILYMVKVSGASLGALSFLLKHHRSP